MGAFLWSPYEHIHVSLSFCVNEIHARVWMQLIEVGSSQIVYHIHCESKKQDTQLLSITSPNIN